MSEQGEGFRQFHEEQRMPGLLRFITVTTEVDRDTLRVRLSSLLAPLSREVPLDQVRDVETHEDLSRHIPGTTRYWLAGVRIVPRVGWAVNTWHRRGVTVHLKDGRRCVIGSSHPERLAEALRSASA